MSEDFCWLDTVRAPVELACVYCGAAGPFEHAMSLNFVAEPFHLHRCPDCASLVYDMASVDNSRTPPIAAQEFKIHGQYYLEAGYNIDFIVLCALSALGDIPDAELDRHIFFDVGAGIGLGAHFVRQIFGADVLAIEPSPTAAMGRQIFDLDLRPDYFEDLAPEVMARLTGKPCLVHLNAVVEHLADPFGTLQELLARLDVASLAIVVPDGGGIDPSMPLLSVLETLSPNEHLHLPTALGVERFLARLGFPHQARTASSGLLIGIGARRPVSIPATRTVELASRLFLERLLRHPHPHVSGGAAARLLPGAVMRGPAALLARLLERLGGAGRAEALLAEIAGSEGFGDLSLHLAPTGFWLAVAAVDAGDPAGALVWLDVVESFADRVAVSHPQYSTQPQLYKWESRLYRADLLLKAGGTAAARALLETVNGAGSASGGADAGQRQRAAAKLRELQ